MAYIDKNWFTVKDERLPAVIQEQFSTKHKPIVMSSIDDTTLAKLCFRTPHDTSKVQNLLSSATEELTTQAVGPHNKRHPYVVSVKWEDLKLEINQPKNSVHANRYGFSQTAPPSQHQSLEPHEKLALANYLQIQGLNASQVVAISTASQSNSALALDHKKESGYEIEGSIYESITDYLKTATQPNLSKALTEKFSQDAEAKSQLLATNPKALVYIGAGTKNYYDYDQFIVEPDSELGIGSNGRGQNQLGKQLTEIRHDFELNARVESAPSSL